MNTGINVVSVLARVRTAPAVGARMGGITAFVTELHH
jgi:hypothetical protein